MGSTTSCCVSASPKLRRNAHSRLESYHQESDLSREETGCNLQHISDRENVDERYGAADNILFMRADSFVPCLSAAEYRCEVLQLSRMEFGPNQPVIRRVLPLMEANESEQIRMQLNMEYNPSDHPRASTIFLSKSQNDEVPYRIVQDKRKSLFINNVNLMSLTLISPVHDTLAGFMWVRQQTCTL
ncbi:hypothetical protein INR49_001121 [Caranx melampygus]|nr:hypothetical protein INR49_001121 [Caranx melampygus]